MVIQIYESTVFFINNLVLFLVVYLFGYSVVFERWRPKDRLQATSCLISLLHGTPVLLMAIHAILSSPSPRTFASPNTMSQNLVLQYSIAYFTIDLLHYLLFVPSDVIFIAHHLGALYVMITCRYVVNHGAVAILGVLVLAEITSPAQNVWSLSGLQRKEVPFAAKLYDNLCVPFLVMYFVVRGIVAPLFVHKMVVFYVAGDGDLCVPRWAWCSWMAVTVIGVAASIPWALNQWKLWHRERNKKAIGKLC